MILIMVFNNYIISIMNELFGKLSSLINNVFVIMLFNYYIIITRVFECVIVEWILKLECDTAT